MRVINALDNVISCFPHGKFDLSAWEEYIAAYSPHLGQKCRQSAIQPTGKYDFEKDILPVLNGMAASKEQLLELKCSFAAAASKLDENSSKLFPQEPEVNIILYLGLCNAAGWATTLDNKDAILLGAEKIIELGWQEEKTMEALIFHELGHIWHKLYGNLEPAAHYPGEHSLVQLYQEGVAMRCQQILCQDDGMYHQNKDGWLDWCMENTEELKQEYFRRVANNESTQDFFGDWCSYQGHSDVGYYLGCQFIKYLEKEYTLVQIANLNISELGRAFTSFKENRVAIGFTESGKKSFCL